MKTLFYFSIGLVACVAEAREAWRVERYAEADGTYGIYGMNEKPARFSWVPSITPGWPLRGGKWVFKWEGTF